MKFRVKKVLLLLWMMMLMLDGVRAFCPYGCGCDEEKRAVTCIRANLEVMPISLNPGIHTLILKYNDFTTVDASFNFYPELELVDLSNNGIVSIPAKAFKSQRSNLRTLKLNENRINQLARDTFHGLRKLKVLELRSNQLVSLPDLGDLEGLESLDLGHNQISEVDAKALSGAGRLRVLKLNDNQLKSVPDGIQGLKALKELYLNRNQILFVPGSSFSLPHLTLLDLGSNLIRDIHPDAFTDLNQVKTLNLEENQLEAVPRAALTALVSLENLKMGRNKFANVPGQAFSDLKQLVRLDISSCPDLVAVDQHAFADSPALKSVTIASNTNLRSLASDAFGRAESLVHLDISNNALTVIPSTLVPWNKLKSLQLAGNPLHCDCDNYFLKEVIFSLVNSSSETVRIVRCYLPSGHRDQDLAQLQLDCTTTDDVATSSFRIQGSDVVTVIVVASVASVFLVISSVLVCVIVRKLNASRTRVPVKDSDILQYHDAVVGVEPRYVSNNLVKANILLNPYHHQQQDSLLVKQYDDGHYATTFDRVDPRLRNGDHHSRFQPYFDASQSMPRFEAGHQLVNEDRSHYEDPISFV